jgi:two-component system sensor histidine kinase KdpD
LLALDYFLESPAYSFQITDPRTAVDVVVFLMIALVLGGLNGQLREALQRTEQARAAAESAIRARDEALAVVSHDLRTPLTAIQATAEVLERSELLDDALRRSLLRNIQAEADRLARFIVDALALGRLDAGVTPRLVDCEIGEIASAVLDQCLPVLGDRPVVFDVSDELPVVRCDPALLERALGNLLTNIADHTPEGTLVSIQSDSDVKHLRLKIGDAGPGIPPLDRERIFMKFERLDNASRGAGLGLALAQAAIVAQGGRLWVADSQWGGAEFVVELPVARPQLG